MSAIEPPLAAYSCDGAGGGTKLDWSGVRTWKPGSGFLWLHLDRSDPGHRRWLHEESGVDPMSVEVLLAEETRPRQIPAPHQLVLMLRGVNLNEGAEPDDMVSLRMLIRAELVVTLRSRQVRAVQDVRAQIDAGKGPASPVAFLVAIADRIVERQVSVVDTLEESLDDVEERLVAGESADLRGRIAELRRTAIGLRRYLAPQRDVLSQLSNDRGVMVEDLPRARMREVADRQTRLVEVLDEARERATIANEELAARMAERMNRNTYVLSIVAGVFLPLGLVTGLLGINVGGIPMAQSEYGFAAVCAALLGMAFLVLWLFRRLHML